MVELILVRTGDKFDEWYVDNLLYMVEKYGNLKYNNKQIFNNKQILF